MSIPATHIAVLAALLAPTAAAAPEPWFAPQRAVLESFFAKDRGYFKAYCVAVNPGQLASPATRDHRIRSVQDRNDPPVALLDQLRSRGKRVVPASQCEHTGEDVYLRATRASPALLFVVGPVELVDDAETMVTVFTTSGFMTETWTLYKLKKTATPWAVFSQKILLQV